MKEIFKYTIKPSCCCFADSHKYKSITIFDDGILRYAEFDEDYIDGETKVDIEYNYKYLPPIVERVEIGVETSKKIEMIINKHMNFLKKINGGTDNGSYDGVINKFNFNGEEIICFNIKRRDIEKYKKDNPIYFEKYEHVMEVENFILDVVEEIVKALSCEGNKKVYNKFEYILHREF